MKWRNSQKGMTLLEMIAGVAIVAMIGIGVVAFINYQVKSTATARASVTVSHEIEKAARLISQDGMMAEYTNITESAQLVDTLDMNWIERYEFVNVPHSSSYYLDGTDLYRNYDGMVSRVAQNISEIEFSKDGDILNVTICCSPSWIGQDRTVEKTYRVYLRAAN